MTAVAVAQPVANPARPRTLREVRVNMTTTTAPDVRRAHPATRSRRPGGAPAPTLRRGALPEQLRPVAGPGPALAPVAPSWRLTDRAIGLIMAVLALLMLASFGAVVAKAIQVTGATSSYTATR